MHLSDNGIIALEQWQWLGDQYPYIDLTSFIVMPDHVHGVIYINVGYYNNNFGNCRNIVWNGRDDIENGRFDVGNGNNDVGNGNNDVGNGNNDVGNGNNDVGNGRDRSLQWLQTNPKSIITKIKPLPELIGAYKTTVSKRIHLIGDIEFKWQKSFHDHIIKNTRELNLIKNYIEKNPEKWADTHFID